MAKDKSGSKAAAAPVASKSVDSVKAGRVTKPAKSSKVVPDTKHKKEREPSPDSASDESDGTSDSSASSDSASDSEDEVDTKVDKKVVNGGSDSGSDSDSSASDSEDEKPANKAEVSEIGRCTLFEELLSVQSRISRCRSLTLRSSNELGSESQWHGQSR